VPNWVKTIAETAPGGAEGGRLEGVEGEKRISVRVSTGADHWGSANPVAVEKEKREWNGARRLAVTKTWQVRFKGMPWASSR